MRAFRLFLSGCRNGQFLGKEARIHEGVDTSWSRFQWGVFQVRVGDINPAVKCGDCGASMVLRLAMKAKKAEMNNRLFYGCSRYREGCRGTHGAHPNGAPLGVPASALVKQLRIQVHDLFDQLWKGEKQGKQLRRARAYAWLGQQMGIPDELCHAGRFDQSQCERAIGLCTARLEALKASREVRL